MEEIPLSVRSHFLLGRAGDLCDIVLEHASVSRRHAVLQFHESGSLWLYDLGAAHGTFVNRARIAPREFVELRVGDQLRFGASTRTYVVEGPDEFRPQEVDKERIAQRQAALQQQQAAAQQRQRQAVLDEKKRLRANGGVDAGAEEDHGASWGMGGEDAVDSDEEHEGGGDGGSSGLSVNSDGSLALPAKLTSTQQKLVEKLSKRREKIQNLSTEVEVLRSKDIRQGGLSAGQEKQIAKNEERLRQMAQEVEEMEAQLAESVSRVATDREKQKAHELGAAATGAAGKKRRRGADSDDDDEGGDSDDDFFDRTKAPPKAKSASGGSGSASAASAGGVSQFLSTLTAVSSLRTPEEIAAELRRIEQKRDQMRHTLQEVAVLEAKEKRVHSSAAASAANAAPAGDSLDSFMSSLTHSALSARKASLKQSLSELQTHYIKLERLLEQRKGEIRTKRYLEGDKDAFKVDHNAEATAPTTATKVVAPVSGPAPGPAPGPALAPAPASVSAAPEPAQPSPAAATAAPAPAVVPQPQAASARPAPSAVSGAPSTADMLARMKKKQEAQARRLREQELAEERAEAQEKERRESAAAVAASAAAAAPRPSGGAQAPAAAGSTPQDRYALLAQQLEAARGHKNYSIVPEDHAARAAKARAMATAASIASDAIADQRDRGAPTARGAASAAAAPRSVGPYAPHVESTALQQAQHAETVEWTPPVASAAAGQDKLRAKFAGRY